jgi:hypothetical protein
MTRFFSLRFAVRGRFGHQGGIFPHVRLEDRIPADYPLRPISNIAQATNLLHKSLQSIGAPFQQCGLVQASFTESRYPPAGG